MNEEFDEAWPEFVYRLVEHYKWETQHLGGTVEEFYGRIRKHEVPLNFLFNLLLSILPSETISLMLDKFGPHPEAEGPFRLKYPWSPSFTQPDVRIESSSARIFIEVKVDEKIKLKQVQRYLLLHALMDVLHGTKRPYLFFLSKKAFEKCWRPSNERSECFDIQNFLLRKTSGDLPDELSRKLKKENAGAVCEQYQVVKRNITYGATTWNALGDCLAKAQAGKGEAERSLIDGFVRDLAKRGLERDLAKRGLESVPKALSSS